MLTRASFIDRVAFRLMPGAGLSFLAFGLIASVAPNRASAGEVPPGKWLVDRGRTIALNTAQPTTDDAEQVLIWMEAAARVNPDLADAYLWQYDLLNHLNRTEAATAALASYCNLKPDDICARFDLLDRQFERQQSVDARLAFCAEKLKAPGLSSVVQSDLHRRMAEFSARGSDRQQAQVHAAKAVEAFSGNVAAHSLLVELADEHERPRREVRMLCAAIAASPARIGEMWGLARLLDDLSLHVEAVRWYERVLAPVEQAAAGGVVPADLLADLALSLADGGQYERAWELGERVLATDPDAVDTRFLLVDVARNTGRAEAADRHLEVLRTRFAEIDPSTLERDDLVRLCRAAWFHLRYEPDTVRAVQLASRARELAPDVIDVQVIFGLAKLAAGETDEAAVILRPWADTNQWAAAGLGEALLAQGQAEEGAAVLRSGEALRYSGRAYERIVAALALQRQEPAPVPRRTAVLEALRGFDEGVLSFPARPVEALRFEASMPQKEWTYSDPWVCELRLTNTSTFPIVIGEEQMVSGAVLVSLRWGDESGEQLINYLPLSLALKPVLAAGESIVLTETLDVGRAAALAQSAPQKELALTFVFLLDPVLDRSGNWVSALGDYPPAVVQVKRVAADVSRAGLQALTTSLQQGGEANRIKAARAMAALIAEREAARITPPADYVPRRIDELRLRKPFLAALTDPVPVVRAAAVEAMRALDLSPRVLEQVAPKLSDASWLVRLEALDMLAETQGTSFRPVLERTSQSDSDELVRRLARLHLKQLPPESAD